MKLIIDASAAIPCFLPQQHTAAARQVFGGRHTLTAPDFMLVEVSNVFWKFCRLGEFDPEGAEAAMGELARRLSHVLPTPPLLGPARAIANRLDHPVYDCIYLAAAEAAQAPVVTADRRFFDRASAGGWRDHVLWIEDLPPTA